MTIKRRKAQQNLEADQKNKSKQLKIAKTPSLPKHTHSSQAATQRLSSTGACLSVALSTLA